jgi:hypothetical protein
MFRKLLAGAVPLFAVGLVAHTMSKPAPASAGVPLTDVKLVQVKTPGDESSIELDRGGSRGGYHGGYHGGSRGGYHGGSRGGQHGRSYRSYHGYSSRSYRHYGHHRGSWRGRSWWGGSYRGYRSWWSGSGDGDDSSYPDDSCSR